MLGRRKALLAIFTSPITARAVTQAATVEAMASISSAANVASLDNEPGEAVGCDDNNIWQFFDMLDMEHYSSMKSVAEMGHNIANKKSWSHAFKSYCFTQDERKHRDMMTALRNDHEMAENVAKMLGFKA